MQYPCERTMYDFHGGNAFVSNAPCWCPAVFFSQQELSVKLQGRKIPGLSEYQFVSHRAHPSPSRNKTNKTIGRSTW